MQEVKYVDSKFRNINSLKMVTTLSIILHFCKYNDVVLHKRPREFIKKLNYGSVMRKVLQIAGNYFMSLVLKSRKNCFIQIINIRNNTFGSIFHY